MVQPEIVTVPLPDMVPTGAPSPATAIKGGATSSAGVYCRDPSGDTGVTACLHATGPVGAPVTVGGSPSVVKLADPVQDIVFIPLPESAIPPHRRGLQGVRTTRPPYQAEPMHFEGVVNGPGRTHTLHHDAGLLRPNRHMQFKVQTRRDIDNGDSGCALVDEDDRVVAFAFHTSGASDEIEMSDWIWADNALNALGLKPL